MAADVYLFAHRGIRVQRPDKLHRRVRLGQQVNGLSDAGYPRMVLAPVNGDRDNRTLRRRYGSRLLYGPAERVDHRVPRHDDALLVNPLAAQVPRALGRRGTVKIRQHRRQAPVDLLGKRRPLVERAQPGLNMAHRHHGVKGRHRRAHDARGVALHDDPIGIRLLDDRAHPLKDERQYVIGILALCHYGKVVVARDVKRR